MNIFEESKAQALKRQPILRIMCSLGMIAWTETHDGWAHQCLRLLHPLSWLYLLLMIPVSIFVQGVPDTVEAIHDTWKEDTVWW